MWKLVYSSGEESGQRLLQKHRWPFWGVGFQQEAAECADFGGHWGCWWVRQEIRWKVLGYSIAKIEK